MKKHLLTAAKIAELKIPGLPASKGAVISRAKKEGWFSEKGITQGGEADFYEIPERYLSGGKPKKRVLFDAEKLEGVVIAVEKALKAKNKTLTPEKKAKVISMLYEQSTEEEGHFSFDEYMEKLFSLT